MTEPKPLSDSEMLDLRDRCNGTGLPYPPDLVEWLNKQPQKIKMGVQPRNP